MAEPDARRVSSTSPSSGALSGRDGGAARSACIPSAWPRFPGMDILSPARTSGQPQALGRINGSGSEPWRQQREHVRERIDRRVHDGEAGSRRNQVAWRFANWWLCSASARHASSSVTRRRGTPSSRGSRSRRTTEGRIPALAQGARLLDEAGVELGPGTRGDPPPVLARPRRRAGGRARAPGRRRARAAARRRAARRSRGRGRRGAGCAGRSGRRGCGAIAEQARPRAPRRRRAPARRRGAPAAPGPTAARPCRSPPRPPAARTPCRRRGCRRRRRAPSRLERRQRVRPEVGDRVRLVGIDEVEAVVDDPSPAPPASPSPCRCRGRGRPAASRPTRSRRGSPGRAAPPPARSRGPVLPVAVGPPRTTSGGRRGHASRLRRASPGARTARRARPARHEPADERRRARHVHELVLARAAGQVGDALGQVRERVARLRGARRLLVVVVVAAAAATTVSTSTSVVAPEPRPVALEPDRLLERRAARSAGGASRRPGRRRPGAWPASRAARCRRPRRPGRSGRSRAAGAWPRTRRRSRRRTRR